MYLPEPPSKRQRTRESLVRRAESTPSRRRLEPPDRLFDKEYRGFERRYGLSRGDPFRRRRESRAEGWSPERRRMRRPRILKVPEPLRAFTENKQFLQRNFRGALQEHLQRVEGRSINIIFNTNKMEYGEKDTLFISHGKWGSTEGEGYGSTRKEAVQQAALDIIQKMGLATEEDVEKYTKQSIATDKAKSKKKGPVPLKDLPKVTENMSYNNGNFRGALLEYLQKAGIASTPIYTTREETTEDNTKVFITTCKDKEGKFEDGLGHASAKKPSIHFASLDFMLKMGLLTLDEHLEKFPNT